MAGGIAAATRGAASRTARAWSTLGGLGSVALIAGLAFLINNLLVPGPARRAQELNLLAKTHVTARNWSAAIDAYEEFLLLVPDDEQARSSLWAVYYERGQQRSTEAGALEEEAQFARAAERWEGALADFRAAQQVDPDHLPDPRGETASCIERAGEGRRLALLVATALDLLQQQRWTEAVQALEATRSQAPEYHQALVAGYLCDALLQRGYAALGRAETSAQVQRVVQMIQDAAAIQPEREQAQVALRRAQAYLQALESIEGQAWEAAVGALEPLLAEDPAYAAGRAAEFLCLARWQRADELSQAGRLQEALADYQAVAAAGCPRQDEAVRRASEIALVLTPTPRPTPTHSPTPTRSATPTPTAWP